jgi:hypothetical protein
MATPTTISEAIENAALSGISEVEVAGRRVKAMTIDEQIKAAQHAATTTAKTRNHLGMMFRTFQPGGGG